MAEPTRPDRAPTAAQTPADRPTVPRPVAGAPSSSVTHDSPPGFVIGGELGEGGMGVVLEATDTELGREVAIKTLRPEYASASAAARFVEEARITARLQHPGIPPIYRTGELPDGRPFLAMKLIRGRTLAALLAAAPSLEDRLSAFEQVCLAVGYAHEHGVIHRDLKPANIMVGAFGEVQVMDWGLAKVLGEVPAPFTESASDGAADETRAGVAMGTPQYMPPEQARGAWHEVDERADVFALGGVLTVLLTGHPPYTGPTSRAVLERAETGDLAECFARLDACGADADLSALAKRCLSAARAQRPANAGEVAEAISAHRAGVRARLAAAEAARAAAEVEAREQKRRRRVQLALAGAVLLIAAGGAAVAVREGVRAERERTEEAQRETERVRLEGEKERAERDRAAALQRSREQVPELIRSAAELRRAFRFADARDVLSRAAALVAGDGAEDLRPAVASAARATALAERLDLIRYRKYVWIANPGGKGQLDYASAPPAYRAALDEHGLDPLAPAPAELAARLAGSDVRQDVLDALDDWAVHEPDAARRDRVLAALRTIDPGSWLDELRAPETRSNPARLEKLARAPGALAASPGAVVALAELLQKVRGDSTQLLESAVARVPDHFALVLALAQAWLERDHKVATGFYLAARALRPNSVTVWTNLGVCYGREQNGPAATAAFERAAALDDKYAAVHHNLGVVYFGAGRYDDAIRTWNRVLEIDSAYDAKTYYNLGVAHSQQKKYPEAIDYFHKAIRLSDTHGPTFRALGMAHMFRAPPNWAAAFDAFGRALALDPMDADAHSMLGIGYQFRGDNARAAPHLVAAACLSPDNATRFLTLGGVLRNTNDPPAAVEAFRRAVALDPASADAQFQLGEALEAAGALAEAERAYREAARLNEAEFGGLLKRLPLVPAPKG